MGQAGRRNRAARKGRKRGWKDSGLVWVGGAMAILALMILPTMSFSSGDHHPEPREHIGHDHVESAAHYAAYPRVANTYAMVARIPHVIDGIYCYCACSEHSGHYSLLDCFKDAHASRCDVCLSEASMAFRMDQDGRSLGEIRQAIDQLYET
jgi:hypothetical protein